MWTRTVAQENRSDHGLKDEVRFREASSKVTYHEQKMLTKVKVRIKHEYLARFLRGWIA